MEPRDQTTERLERIERVQDRQAEQLAELREKLGQLRGWIAAGAAVAGSSAWFAQLLT